MPELPEVEHLRRTLAPLLVGARVVEVKVRRRSVVHGVLRSTGAIGLAEALLRGRTVGRLERHGKQMAIVAATGEAICVHLGMSGQLRLIEKGEVLAARNHVHVEWELEGVNGKSARLVFRDPRRFGGLWGVSSMARLEEKWQALGPDALLVDLETLWRACQGTKRNIKSVLLDQTVLAGVGNIYADESLHAARIHPAQTASRLAKDEVDRLCTCIRQILAQSIAAHGTTFRDYVDGKGHIGSFVQYLAVYGRAGERCQNCSGRLSTSVIAGRTTVFCVQCQHGRARRGFPQSIQVVF